MFFEKICWRTSDYFFYMWTLLSERLKFVEMGTYVLDEAATAKAIAKVMAITIPTNLLQIAMKTHKERARTSRLATVCSSIEKHQFCVAKKLWLISMLSMLFENAWTFYGLRGGYTILPWLNDDDPESKKAPHSLVISWSWTSASQQPWKFFQTLMLVKKSNLDCFRFFFEKLRG